MKTKKKKESNMHNYTRGIALAKIMNRIRQQNLPIHTKAEGWKFSFVCLSTSKRNF